MSLIKKMVFYKIFLTKISFKTLLFILLTFLILTSCQTGGGDVYSPKEWTELFEKAGGWKVIKETSFRKEAPIYNLHVNPKKSRDPIILFPGKETDLTFYIGPVSTESVLDIPPDSRITEHEGNNLALTVTLNCSFCENTTYHQDQIVYRPKDRRSSKARFSIVPSAAAVRNSNGMGDLIFSIEERANILDRIRVQAFVGDPIPEERASYKSPTKVPFVTLPIEEGKHPDIVIEVGYAGVNGKLPIIIRPRLKNLNNDFKEEFGDGNGKGLEKSWKFISGVTKSDLDGLVLKIYKIFRTINMQKNTQLQEEFRRLGYNVKLEKKASLGHFSEKDRDMILNRLKEEGQNLYWRIFLNIQDGADPNLKKAMDFIDNFYSDSPLRVSIRTADIYAPWQILYPSKKASNKEDKVDSKKFWGFRYALSFDHMEHSGQSRQQNVIRINKPHQVAFAGYRGNDTASELAKELENYIQNKTDGKAAAYYEKEKFFEDLKKHAPSIRFVFAYGHATSGTVVEEKVIRGVEWAEAHFKFSDEDYLAPQHFDTLARTVYLKSRPIIILDACETGTFGINEYNNNGFVGALTRIGAGAVIVTESPVLAGFAYQFGTNLIDELFDKNVDVSQAILNVRLKHLKKGKNPLGLAYTLYGNPAARISRTENVKYAIELESLELESSISVLTSKYRPGSIIYDTGHGIRWIDHIESCNIPAEAINRKTSYLPADSFSSQISFEPEAIISSKGISAGPSFYNIDRIGLYINESGSEALDIIRFKLFLQNQNSESIYSECIEEWIKPNYYLVTEGFFVSKGTYEFYDKSGVRLLLNSSNLRQFLRLEPYVNYHFSNDDRLIIEGKTYIAIRSISLEESFGGK